jgi:hypothetical protein
MLLCFENCGCFEASMSERKKEPKNQLEVFLPALKSWLYNNHI